MNYLKITQNKDIIEFSIRFSLLSFEMIEINFLFVL